ncbi:MAG: beta-propeller fold lactonase family protein [Catenulispora sp.]|nr:beta-propeller fold lactonase family protein [Catenulispora sp.]
MPVLHALNTVEDGIVSVLTSRDDRPRHFALVGSRIYVATERSGQISMLTVDPESGLPGDPRIVAEVAKPTCVPARGPR